MSTLHEIWARVEETASSVGLRPAYPPVVLDLEQSAISLVRLKKRRGRKPLLEAHVQRAIDTPLLPDSIFEPAGVRTTGLSERLQELFDLSGTRPGRVSLVLPDNLAKISLLHLPERPAGVRELRELVHAKMRRAVPFRLEDVAISYQIIPGEGREVGVLVVLVHRSLVERLESALERIGARPGLIDLATPNLLNVSRAQVNRLGEEGGDVALLNCASRYFSLVITRGGKVIFYRCKTFAPVADGSSGPNGSLRREVGHSFSYYREKLGGQGIGSILLRASHVTTDAIAEQLSSLECGRIRKLDVGDRIELGEGVSLDAAAAQRLAPAIGAAIAEGGVMRTLDLNLATRPFRNNTLVWLGYVILLFAAVGFSYWNLSSYTHYKHELVDLDDIQGNRQQEQADLLQRHRQVRQAVRNFDVKSIGRRTSKANQVIEWKAFSWTRLFNRLEEMLPYKVRMTSVRPIFRERDRNVEDGDLRYSISVAVEGLARDLSAFHDIQTKLIDHDSFGHVEPRYVDKADNGEYSFAVNFLYYPGEEPEFVEEADAEADAVSAEAEPEVAANEPVETAPAPAAQRKLPPADPKPAEVTDDWAENAESEDAKARTAEDSQPKPRRRLPRVEPEEPDTAAAGEQGSPR